MYEIKIQKQTFKIPSSINDVSLGRFIAFRNISPDNMLSLVEWVLNAKPLFSESNEVENEIANALNLVQPTIDEIYSFMNTKYKNDKPKTIEVLGETLNVKDINELPYWAYAVTKRIVLKHSDIYKQTDVFDPTDDIPTILAHYLYSASTKRDYNEDEAERFIEVVNDIPMKEAIQLGNFFLRKHQGLFPSSKRLSRQTSSLTISRQE